MEPARIRTISQHATASKINDPNAHRINKHVRDIGQLNAKRVSNQDAKNAIWGKLYLT
jgi:hypothetical protein